MILGFSELLAASTDRDAVTYQHDLDTVYRNARHLSSLIDDILDLAQIDAARMGLVREFISIANRGAGASSSWTRMTSQLTC